MDNQQAQRFQQTEFFLLHNLLVEELRILKRTKRITPAAATTVQEGTACLARLFRSFLVKSFPEPMAVSKTPYRLEFTVRFDDATRQVIQRLRDTEEYRALNTPELGEIGLVRSGAYGMTLAMGGRQFRRSRWYRTGWEPIDLGIGQFCKAAKAVLSWKSRLGKTLAAAEEEGPPAPKRNMAQEQLEAAIRAASEAGRL